DVDPILLDELPRSRRGDSVVGGAVLELELERPPQQATLGVDVADDHPGDVGVREPDDRERAGLVGDHSHPDRVARSWRCCHHVLLEKIPLAGLTRATRRERMVPGPGGRYIGSTPYLGRTTSPR